MSTMNVSEAKSRFSELLSRAAAGERIVIQRRERPVAVLVSPGEMERLERGMRLAHQLASALGQDQTILERIEVGELHPAMAAFGLWQQENDLADVAHDIHANRQREAGREVAL